MVFRLALAWGCSSREVLARITSEELAEWVAFERFHGPIDGTYERMMLNEIQYQLQGITHMLGAVHFSDPEEGKDNPVPDPRRMPLPWEMPWEEQDGQR